MFITNEQVAQFMIQLEGDGSCKCALSTFAFSSNLPEGYAGLFSTGTKPSDWSVTPPAKEELLQYLSQQLNQLSEISPSILEQPLQSPLQLGPLSFETVGELFNFAIIHEAMHLSTISALQKVSQQQA